MGHARAGANEEAKGIENENVKRIYLVIEVLQRNWQIDCGIRTLITGYL